MTSEAIVKQYLDRLRDDDLPEYLDYAEIGVHTRGHFGNYPLHIAVIRNEVDVVKALIDCGADFNAVGEYGFTPLHEAYAFGHRKIIELLLDSGANPFATNDDGDRPIDLAEQS